MTFYHRTLHYPTCINHLVSGNFLHEKKEDIVVSSGRILRLLRFKPNRTKNKIKTLITVDINDIICNLSKFRKMGNSKDFIIITTEFGYTSIISVNAENMLFEKIFEKMVNSKVPRNIPVHYLATDSRGRAFYTAGIQDTIQFWVFNGPNNDVLEEFDISKKNILICDIAFVDIDSENLVIAYLAIENEKLLEHECLLKRKPPRMLVFCEINNGKETELKTIECLNPPHSLISVPGQRGVLVCEQSFVTYYSMDSPQITCPIPRRIDDFLINVMFVCIARYYGESNIEKTKPIEERKETDSEKTEEIKEREEIDYENMEEIKEREEMDCEEMKESEESDSEEIEEREETLSEKTEEIQENERTPYYYLAQTEQGDIFKIKLCLNQDGVEKMVLKYFVTLPVASALCTLKSGHLFLASEFRCHLVYKLSDLEYHSRIHRHFDSIAKFKGRHYYFKHRIPTFEPTAKMSSFSPIMQIAFSRLSTMKHRMCMAIGKGSLSELKICDREVGFQFRAKIEKRMNEEPVRMWAIESTPSICQKPVILLVVSFVSTTAFYVQEEQTTYLRKRNIPLFARKTSTLWCAKTASDVIIQVCPEGIFMIRNKQHLVACRSSEENKLVFCTMNKKSLVVSNQSNHLDHYKINQFGIVENSVIPRKPIDGTITCILLSDRTGEMELLAVGISHRSLTTSSGSVNKKKKYEIKLFAVSNVELQLLCKLEIMQSPYSFVLLRRETTNVVFLLVGSENGRVYTIFKKTHLERNEHQLKIVRIEQIGTKAVKLFIVPALERQCFLAISNKWWLKQTVFKEFKKSRIELSSCICILPGRDKLITISEDSLRILVLENIYSEPTTIVPLEYTPKNIAVDSHTGTIFIAEADNKCYTRESRQKMQTQLQMFSAAAKNPGTSAPKFEFIERTWASAIRCSQLVGKPLVNKVSKIELDQNEAALSLSYLNHGFDNLLLVGVAKGFKPSIGSCEEASIFILRITEHGGTARYEDKIAINGAPVAMCCDNGKVFVSMRKALGIFQAIPNSLAIEMVFQLPECVDTYITGIYLAGKRIYVTDSKGGTSCILYDSDALTLHLLEKDIFPHEVTAACILSNNRMVRATTSRDIIIVKLGTVQTVDEPSSSGPPAKLSEETMLASVHIGEIVTSIETFRGYCNESECVLYSTLSGSIGMLSEITWPEDVEFLEGFYATMKDVTTNKDKRRTKFYSWHPLFRSRHYTSKKVVDGHFLDNFYNMEQGFQLSVCWLSYEPSVQQVEKRLESIKKEALLDFPFYPESWF